MCERDAPFPAQAACVPATTSIEGIGFRQARFQEISTMRDYRGCIDDALKISDQAKGSGQSSGYRTSAKIFERCEADLGPEATQLAREERMRNYALGIINYIKAGEIRRAQTNMKKFQKAFNGNDLYLPNGASFIDSVTLLTTKHDDASAPEMAMMNVSSALRAEFNRMHFWKNN